MLWRIIVCPWCRQMWSGVECVHCGYALNGGVWPASNLCPVCGGSTDRWHCWPGCGRWFHYLEALGGVFEASNIPVAVSYAIARRLDYQPPRLR